MQDLVIAFVAHSGFPVFPCVRNEKRPATRRGFYDASRDPAQIRRWAQKNPDCNWAIATEAAGLTVIDVDIKKGKAGDATLRALTQQHGELPDTYCVNTPSGGVHFYFATPAGVSIRSGNGKLGLGVDVKAGGGYVLIPPSVINGTAYTVASESPRSPLPAWLVELTAE
jgi:hypothetical protein